MSVTVASTLSIGAVFLLGALLGWLLRGRECATLRASAVAERVRASQLATKLEQLTLLPCGCGERRSSSQPYATTNRKGDLTD